MVIRAVMFDFGGVISSSPFESFARLEAERGLPPGFIRTVNSTDPDDNAWAQLERGEVDVDTFGALWSAEARALGHDVDGRHVLEMLAGEIRPQMVAAIRSCSSSYKTACLTNNFSRAEAVVSEEVAAIYALFDAVLESRVLGVRKPDPRFYELACERLGVSPGGVRVPRRPGSKSQARPRSRHAHHKGERSRAGAGRAGACGRIGAQRVTGNAATA